MCFHFTGLGPLPCLCPLPCLSHGGGGETSRVAVHCLAFEGRISPLPCPRSIKAAHWFLPIAPYHAHNKQQNNKISVMNLFVASEATQFNGGYKIKTDKFMHVNVHFTIGLRDLKHVCSRTHSTVFSYHKVHIV